MLRFFGRHRLPSSTSFPISFAGAGAVQQAWSGWRVVGKSGEEHQQQ